MSTFPKFDSRTFDVELLLADEQTVIETGALTIASVARIVDVGAAHLQADVVLDVGAIVVAEADESYAVLIQGSTASDFSTGKVNLAIRLFGVPFFTHESVNSRPNTRHILSFSNAHAGTVYRYIRAFVFVGVSEGTPSITIKRAFITTRN
jgi:hypothetical protein